MEAQPRQKETKLTSPFLESYDTDSKRGCRVEVRLFYNCTENQYALMARVFVIALEMLVRGAPDRIARLEELRDQKLEVTDGQTKSLAMLISQMSGWDMKNAVFSNAADLDRVEEGVLALPESEVETKFAILSRINHLRIRLLRNAYMEQIRHQFFLPKPPQTRCERCGYGQATNILLQCTHVFCKTCLADQCILSFLLKSPVRCLSHGCVYVLTERERKQAAGNVKYIKGLKEKEEGKKTLCERCATEILKLDPSCSSEELQGKIDSRLVEKLKKERVCCHCEDKKEIKTEEDGSQLGCGHWHCAECLNSYKKSVMANKFVGKRRVKCTQCGYILRDKEIIALWGLETFSQLSMRQMELDKMLFRCAKCNSEARFDPTRFPAGKPAKCRTITGSQDCDANVCLICGEEFHEPPCQSRIQV